MPRSKKTAQQKHYKKFSKPFYKLLTKTLVVFVAIFGGVVYTQTTSFQNLLTDLNNECKEESGVDFKIYCGYFAPKDSTSAGGTDYSIRTFDIDGEKLKITNRGAKNYYISLKTDNEQTSFLNAWKGNEAKRKAGEDNKILDVDVCEVGVAKGNSENFETYGVEGCGIDAPECEIQIITGQQCRVKANVADWTIINEKLWLNDVSFDWDGDKLEANDSDSANYYWKTNNNNSRVRCGPNNANVGTIAYGPRYQGDKWGKYKCVKSSNWTCFYLILEHWCHIIVPFLVHQLNYKFYYAVLDIRILKQYLFLFLLK